MRSRIWKLLFILVVLLSAGIVLAQDDDSGNCPTLVQEAFTATELICEGVTTNQACFGNGIIEFEPRAGAEELVFAQAGDRAPLTDFQAIRLRSLNTENAIWASILIHLDARTSASGAADVMGLVFGDVSLNNASQASSSTFPTLSGRVAALNGIVVRRGPASTETVVWQLVNNEEITLTGRSSDNTWLRIQIPSAFGGPGWVAAQFIDYEGALDTLRIVTAADPAPDLAPPEYGPMQSFSFQSGLTDESCEDTPDSGILLQSPNGLADNVRLLVNGAELQFNGTVFLQAQSGGELRVTVLEGLAILTAGSASQTVPSGTQSSVTLDADLVPLGTPSAPAAFDSARFIFLPIRLLARPFEIAEAAPDSAGATFGQPPAPESLECVLTLPAGPENKILRAGPGVDYAIADYMSPGQRLNGIGRASDTFGYIWYLTDHPNAAWIRFDVVESTSSCAELPIVAAPSLESAQPDTTPVPGGASLVSSQFGEICGRVQTHRAPESDGANFFINIGGTWTAKAGTTAVITAGEGQFRGEYGDFIRIVGADGTIVARSGQASFVTHTFAADTTFTIEFSAAKGDSVTMTASCN